MLQKKDSLLTKILSIGGALLIGLYLWMHQNKSHEENLKFLKNIKISGIITHKETYRGDYLYIKTNNSLSQDTCINGRIWGKLFDECQINDTLIKKAGSYDIIIKRNSQTRIYTFITLYP